MRHTFTVFSRQPTAQPQRNTERKKEGSGGKVPEPIRKQFHSIFCLSFWVHFISVSFCYFDCRARLVLMSFGLCRRAKSMAQGAEGGGCAPTCGNHVTGRARSDNPEVASAGRRGQDPPWPCRRKIRFRLKSHSLYGIITPQKQGRSLIVWVQKAIGYGTMATMRSSTP